ncbi:MAG: hypothetical protein AB7G28_23840 [Pirellulales bacterium]
MFRTVPLLVVLFCVSVIDRVCAVPVLDQVSPAGGVTFYKADTIEWQQGVSAGVTGRLSQIEMSFYTTEEVQLTLYHGLPWGTGVPDYFLSFHPTAVDAPTFVDVSAADFMVTAGSAFTIGLRGFNPNTELFLGTDDNGYAGGQLYLNQEIYHSGEYDMAFNTYVDPVPEPTQGIMLGTCVAIPALTLRRRRER